MKKDNINDAYFHSAMWGPAFGARDLSIMRRSGHCCENGEISYFGDGDLIGNTLLNK